jgi:hypothetical protein
MKKIALRMELSCGHALKFEPTGDTQFAPNEVGHQKTPEIIDAYNDLFLNVYPKFHPNRMLEIGIWHGGSLSMWRDVFDTCQIIGVDCQDLMSPTAKAHLAEDPRVSWQLFTCPSPKLGEMGNFEFIIDDGGHGTEVVFPTFEILWPKLAPGGIFVIEDWKPDFCNPNEMLHMLSNRIRGYWPADDAGPNAPFKVIVYRGLIAIEKKR